MPVPHLPCCGTLQLEITCTGEQFLENIDLGTTFGFILTENLHDEFCDEWLVSSKNCISEAQADVSAFTNQARLYISCSFDMDLVLARQKGLWPSSLIDPLVDSFDCESCDIKVSTLMPKSSLVYRQKLQPTLVESQRFAGKEPSRSSHLHSIHTGNDSPVEKLGSDAPSASSYSKQPRTRSPQRDRRPRQRPQRRYSEVASAAFCYAFTYEHERPYSRERLPSPEPLDFPALSVLDPVRP